MAPKDKFNLSLPPSVKKEFDRIAANYGDKSKGIVLAAAMLNFLRLSSDEQSDLIDRAILADRKKNFEPLLAWAKASRRRGPFPSIPPENREILPELDSMPPAEEKETAKTTRAGRSK